MDLQIDTHRRGRLVVVTPRGEIDMATSRQFREALEGLVVDGHVHLVVDLDSVTFLDSTGLGALIGARRRTHAFRGSFALLCAGGELPRALELTGLDRVFRILDSLPEDDGALEQAVREDLDDVS
ncbi:MAG TPA: STAS domain-containing protein [Marmoricola sp.]|nr:STAS domain-containing protein [Marmoricola sp.]